MRYRIMRAEDLELLAPLYAEYFNSEEDSCWTPERAYKRLHQLLSIDGSYGLVAEEGGEPAGFCIGCFQVFADLDAFEISEILVFKRFQGSGRGSEFVREVERRVRELGAPTMQLEAVNDEMHDHFYGKLGFKYSKTNLPMCKWIVTDEQ